MALPTPEEVQVLVAELANVAQAYSNSPDLNGYMSRVQIVEKARKLTQSLISPEQLPNYHGLNMAEGIAIRTFMKLKVLDAIPMTGSISLSDLAKATGAQESLLERMARVLGETLGWPQIWDTNFPSNVKCISQTLWGSIGFALPAAQGAATASREMTGQRVILFIGDGSFQVTAQALSTMIANKLNVTIFLINNSGYTMERWVHGMEAHYNDIPEWKYTDVPVAFGGSEEAVKTYKVNTKTELEALLADKSFQAGKGVRFVDMLMPKEDASLTLRLLCISAAKSNAGHVK